MKKSKNLLRAIVFLAICLGVSACFCTPQDVDDFAEGFKEGYFGDDYDKR